MSCLLTGFSVLPSSDGNTAGRLKGTHYLKKCFPFILVLLICALFVRNQSTRHAFTNGLAPSRLPPMYKADTIIIAVTPTHRRSARLADMTRLSQTLSQVKNLHWIVIEDASATSPAVERILKRSRLPHAYFQVTSDPGMPRRGWTHRNHALQFIRENYKDLQTDAVVYFADDDNSYDIRLFDKYIRKVRRMGIWAVGLAGMAAVEAPHVVNDTIVGWNVVYAPGRPFATDMAGFGLNLKEIIRVPNATFGRQCIRQSPETCFLAQFGIKKEEAEPFGYDDNPKEILVWHTKTHNIGALGKSHGYVVE